MKLFIPMLVAISPLLAADRTFPEYAHRYRDQYTRMMAFGPLALLSIADELGLELDQVVRTEIVSVAENGGTDLLQLKRLAEKLGLSALGVQGSRKLLFDSQLSAIIVRGESTFVAVLKCKGSSVFVRGPLEDTQELAPEAFDRIFGDSFPCLLVADKPVDALALGISMVGTRRDYAKTLIPSATVLSLGRITTPNWAGEHTLRNSGDVTVHISNVRTTCACVTASATVTRLKPGETTTISVKGVHDHLGVIQQAVIVDAGTAGELHVPIRGWLAPPAFFDTPTVVIDSLIVGELRQQRVNVLLPAGTDPADLKWTLPEGSPLDFSLEKEPALEGYSAAYNLECRGHADWIGLKKWQIKAFNISDDQQSVPAILEVVCDTRLGISATPSSLLIKPAEIDVGWWSRTIDLQSVEPVTGELKATWNDETAESFLRLTVERTSERSFQLNICPIKNTRTNRRGREFLLHLATTERPDLPVVVRLTM